MAIEKISLVHVVGKLNDLDATLLKCLESGYFHPEMAVHAQSSHGLNSVEGENPYTAPLNDIIRVCESLHINPNAHDFDKAAVTTESVEEIKEFISNVENQIGELAKKRHDEKDNILTHEQVLSQVKHLQGLDTSFESLFACEYVKVRFGRLPVDSFPKLDYYEDKTFFFFHFDKDDEYYYGVYFAPYTKIAVIDNLFSTLFFERIRVPDYAEGTPQNAIATITKMIEEEKEDFQKLTVSLAKIENEYKEKLLTYYCMLRFGDTTFNLRKYAATVNKRFYLVGFVPTKKVSEFADSFSGIAGVTCSDRPYDSDPTIQPPVKLKNNWFTKPFEMFTTMYSLPSHSDIDPTPILAITYTLLFGIMFGDLGQGLVLALLGFLLRNKLSLGKIMMRIGVSSAFFGTLYGSVFGFEHLLDPMYKAIFGLPHKPIEIFDTATTNLILVGAIGIGLVLIILSMCINIFNGFRTKDYGKAIFSNNGIAGLVLFLAAAFAVVDMMLLQKGIISTPYILLLIVLPILLMFLRDPLSKLLKGKKDFMPKNIGEFIIENFFELFEYCLSYLSNSMSFLRVGGFILSHAGMMAVVMSLSEMMSKNGGTNLIVVIIGNIFVMALEGLIVGIQVLRLEFYEMFSRHFEGNGKPYLPATVTYEIED